MSPEVPSCLRTSVSASKTSRAVLKERKVDNEKGGKDSVEQGGG